MACERRPASRPVASTNALCPCSRRGRGPTIARLLKSVPGDCSEHASVRIHGLGPRRPNTWFIASFAFGWVLPPPGPTGAKNLVSTLVLDALAEVLASDPNLAAQAEVLRQRLLQRCPANPQAVDLLCAAALEAVPQCLLSAHTRGTVKAAIPEQAAVLGDNRFLSAQAARWAVETWAGALDVLPSGYRRAPAPPKLLGSGRKPRSYVANRMFMVRAMAGERPGAVLYEGKRVSDGLPVLLEDLGTPNADVGPGTADVTAAWIEDARRLQALKADGLLKPIDVVQDHDAVVRVYEQVDVDANLARQLKTAGPLAPDAIMPVLDAVVPAVLSIHEAGLGHYALVPENVLIDQSGAYRLAFPLGRFAAFRQEAAAWLRRMTGPPEPIGGNSQEAAADVFMLAAFVHQLRTGQRPTSSARGRIEVAPDIPHSEAEMIEEALSADPRRRPRLTEFLGVARTVYAPQECSVFLLRAPIGLGWTNTARAQLDSLLAAEDRFGQNDSLFAQLASGTPCFISRTGSTSYDYPRLRFRLPLLSTPLSLIVALETDGLTVIGVSAGNNYPGCAPNELEIPSARLSGRRGHGTPDNLRARLLTLPDVGEADPGMEKRLARWTAYLTVAERQTQARAFECAYTAGRHVRDGKFVEVTLGVIPDEEEAKLAAAVGKRERIDILGTDPADAFAGFMDDEKTLPLVGRGRFAARRGERLLIELDEQTIDEFAATDGAIPTCGALAFRPFGDLYLIQAQRLAIDKLRGGKAALPALGSILFGNNQEVPLPPAPDGVSLRLDDCLAKNRINGEQRDAVAHALATPDAFFLQGPPGTGKTTFIAEMCYQAVRQGKRVLVASQANLAVDNALSRLSKHPDLLAVRLGDESRIGEDGRTFVGESAVKRWLGSLAGRVEERRHQRARELAARRLLLDGWPRVEAHIAVIEESERKSAIFCATLRSATNVLKTAPEQIAVAAQHQHALAALLDHDWLRVPDARLVATWNSPVCSSVREEWHARAHSQLLLPCPREPWVELAELAADGVLLAKRHPPERALRDIADLSARVRAGVTRCRDISRASSETTRLIREESVATQILRPRSLRLLRLGSLGGRALLLDAAEFSATAQGLLRRLTQLEAWLKGMGLPRPTPGVGRETTLPAALEDWIAAEFRGSENLALAGIDRVGRALAALRFRRRGFLDHLFLRGPCAALESAVVPCNAVYKRIIDALAPNAGSALRHRILGEVESARTATRVALDAAGARRAGLQATAVELAASLDSARAELQSDSDALRRMAFACKDIVRTWDRLPSDPEELAFEVDIRLAPLLQRVTVTEARRQCALEIVDDIRRHIGELLKNEETRIAALRAQIDRAKADESSALQDIARLAAAPASAKSALEVLGITPALWGASSFSELRDVRRRIVDSQTLPEEIARAKAEVSLLDDWLALLRTGLGERKVEPPLWNLFMRNVNVVGCTCMYAGKKRFVQQFAREAGRPPFDLVVVDEVSKATPTELLVPCLLGRQIVLVGDHKQLPPIINEESSFVEAAAELHIDATDIQSTLERSLFKERFEELHSLQMGRTASLLRQYRMHSAIMEAINQFYDEALVCGDPDQDADREHGLSCGQWLRPADHLVWIDVPYSADWAFTQDGASRANDHEVELLRGMLSQLVPALIAKNEGATTLMDLGITSVYGAQVRRLRSVLDTLPRMTPTPRLTTVDQFQGMEKDVMVVSLVMNRSEDEPRRDVPLSRFLQTPERINVAFSRARRLLIIVGCHTAYTTAQRGRCAASAIYGRIYDVARSHGSVRRVTDVVD